MSEVAFTHEAESSLKTVAVGIPGIHGHGWNYLAVIDLPRDIDLAEMWQSYNFCSGRVNYSVGGRHAHKSVMFDEWLLAQHGSQGAVRRSLTRLPEDDISDIPAEAQATFFPDFAELSLHLR